LVVAARRIPKRGRLNGDAVALREGRAARGTPESLLRVVVEVQSDPAAGVQLRWAAGILEVLGGPPPGAEVEQGARRACVQGRQAVAP